MRDLKRMFIANTEISTSSQPYFIAELSGNHNQDISRALDIIRAAKSAGANAVKLQTYTADTITIDHDSPDFMITEGLWKGFSLYSLYTEAHTPWAWYPQLIDAIRRHEMDVICTPFDRTSVDFLSSFNVDAIKIASFEIVDHDLISCAAALGKPLIISTGMAEYQEIVDAVRVAETAGASDIAILHCVSGYPTPIYDCNLKTIQHLSEHLNTVIGLSDHTLGTTVAVSAVSLGASLIEKHLTISRSEGGLDSAFSLEPEEFHRLVGDCLDAWKAIGQVNFGLVESEKENFLFRRSLYSVQDIEKDERLSLENIRSIRPGFGLAPKFLPEILGKRALVRIPKGTALDLSMIS